MRAPPRDAVVSLPLAPSRLAPYEHDDEGDPLAGKPSVRSGEVPAEPAVPSPISALPDYKFLRGTLTHALLEHLPQVPEGQRAQAARRYVSLRASDLPGAIKESIVSETLAILDDTQFAPLFGPRSRAEVAIAAEIARPDARGPALRLTGKIDRLAEVGEDIMIVDYKTNRAAPDGLEGVAEAYLLQLAAYRLALQTIYPGRRLRAALLWTIGPKILEIPTDELEHAEGRLWERAAASS
jgi:ATP-dependent helicase/nuclease subunit A